MEMFRIMRLTCIVALILITVRAAELTSGSVRLKNRDRGPERQIRSTNPMTRGTSKGRNYNVTMSSEDSSTTSSEAEEESSTVGTLNRWAEGIKPWTDALDCCEGFINKNCNNCTMESANCTEVQFCSMLIAPQCEFDCGYLLLPKNSTPGEVWVAQLKAQSGSNVKLTVSYRDLRQGDNITVSNIQSDKQSESITCGSFTKEEQEKYFLSKDDTLLVNYESSPSTEREGCDQNEEPTEGLQFNTIKKVECNIPISEDADGTLNGQILSPSYPLNYPSPRDCTWTIKAPSPGYAIELKVNEFDLDGANGDYIQVNAGSASSKSRKYLMTWTNAKPQQVFKIFSGVSATIHFHSSLHLTPNRYKGFQIVYTKYGNGSLPANATTPGPALPTPSQGYKANYTIFLAGKTPEEFDSDKNSFKYSLVNIANAFCQEEHIELTDPVSFQDVLIHSIMHCPPTWPHSHRCIEVIIQIVAKTVSGEYELTASNLQKMWDRYGWDRNVTISGITPYERNPEVITWWLVGILSILTLFIIILLAAWYFQTNPLHSGSKKKEKTADLAEDKTTETNRFEYPNPPFRTLEEEDEDDISSYTSDHRDSYIDYEGSTTYSNYNDSTLSMGKINPAYIHEDEDELDEINLGAEDFKFQFVNSSVHSRLDKNRHTPAQQRSLMIQMNAVDENSETVL